MFSISSRACSLCLVLPKYVNIYIKIYLKVLVINVPVKCFIVDHRLQANGHSFLKLFVRLFSHRIQLSQANAQLLRDIDAMQCQANGGG